MPLKISIATGCDLTFEMPEGNEAPSREARVIGALLGAHAGDSLGATCEFQSQQEIATQYPTGLDKIVGGGAFNWSAGHATDDTDMMRGLLLAYSEVQSDQDIALLAGKHFLDWYTGDWPGRKAGSRPVDIGGATAEGLSRFAKTKNPDESGAGQGRAGNGSLMRCLPTGLFRTDEKTIISESTRISRITHRDDGCQISCAAYNWLVAKLLDGQSPAEAVDAAEALSSTLENDLTERSSRHLVSDAIRLGKKVDLATLARLGPDKEDFPGKCSGLVTETLTLAIAAVLDRRSFKKVLVDVVRVGKDTDTNACVAGGLLGARDGEGAIPKEWRNTLQFGREFTALGRLIMLQMKH